MEDLRFGYGHGSSFVDATRIVLERFARGDEIALNGVAYGAHFPDPAPGVPKVLRVSCDGAHSRSPVHIADSADFRMLRHDRGPAMPIHVVYFINIGLSDSYALMMGSQLGDLRDSGLLQEPGARFHAVVTGPADRREKAREEIHAVIPAAEFEYQTANQFEYPGVRRAWQLARQDGAGLTLYFHAKGLSQHKNASPLNPRFRDELPIFQHVVRDWRSNLWVFRRFPSINKLGASAGGIGWAWFNFWWARNSYLAQCEEPLLTQRRHYYEDWLGRFRPSGPPPPGGQERPYEAYAIQKDDCFSVCVSPQRALCNIGTLYTPDGAYALACKGLR